MPVAALALSGFATAQDGAALMDTEEQIRQQNSAFVFIAIASLCFLGSFILLFDRTMHTTSIGTTWLGLILGNVGFLKFRKAELLKPPAPEKTDVIHATQFFTPVTRNQQIVGITVEIQYPPEQNSMTTMMRVKVVIERLLNTYFSQLEHLPANLYNEVDTLLIRELDSIKREVKLSDLLLRTVKIEPPIGVSET